MALLIYSSVIGIVDGTATVGQPVQADADRFRPTLDRAWPVDDVPYFHELLRTIDDADREFRGERDRPMVY